MILRDDEGVCDAEADPEDEALVLRVALGDCVARADTVLVPVAEAVDDAVVEGSEDTDGDEEGERVPTVDR